MNEVVFWGALELGCIYGLVGLGVFMTFRVVHAADLTVDGSFALGAVCLAAGLRGGLHPALATGMAAAAGAAAGWVTARLTRLLQVDGMLPSILTMLALYSLNLRILGAPNVALFEEVTLLEGALSPLVVLALFPLGAIALLTYYLACDHGLAMRAAGLNARMAAAQGIGVAQMTQLAYMLGNALVALAGALFAQSQGFADVYVGTGTVIIGLAAVLVGEAMVPSRRLGLQLLGCLLGAILYRLFIGFALGAGFIGLQASDLHLITALLVIAALLFARLRRGLRQMVSRAP